ncbi:MAG: succinylglutamate desuccinylase/aspartoacylase family protein [Bacteroidota bacterium]
MVINQIEVTPGTVRKIDVEVAKLPSRSPIDISITVARSQQEGPVLLLSGGLHGDEINGIEIVRRIIDQNLHIPTAGTVICIPIINVYGFIHFSRYVPDGKDVNRSFPGSKSGSLAARVAHYVSHNILPMIDYGIDFHTGGADRTNYPQIRCMMNDEKNAELAKAFDAPFTLHSSYRPKSFRQTASKLGKNILVYEGGEAARFDEFAITEGIAGTIRLMQYLGMRDDDSPQRSSRGITLKKTYWIRAKTSGVFQTNVQYGETVKKGQLLGFITDPFGDFKVPIKSASNGYVVGLNNNPILHQGDAIINIGTL